VAGRPVIDNRDQTIVLEKFESLGIIFDQCRFRDDAGDFEFIIGGFYAIRNYHFFARSKKLLRRQIDDVVAGVIVPTGPNLYSTLFPDLNHMLFKAEKIEEHMRFRHFDSEDFYG